MRYFLVLAAVNLMWAFQFSGVKFATEALGPGTVVVVTLVLSTLLLLPFLRFEKRREGGRMTPRWAMRFLILGFGASVSQLGMTWGTERSLASNAAVLNLTIPVITAVFAALLLSERMTALRWASFALALCGAAIVTDLDWRAIDFVHSRFALGNALILAGCGGSAFYNTYSKKLLEAFGPIRVMVYSFGAAAAILAPVVFAVEHPSLAVLAKLGWPAWSSVLAIAVFSLSLSMLLFLWVIEKVDVTQASLSIYLIPVFGVLISSWTLHEPLTWRLGAGAALVFVSTFLVTIYEERRKSVAAPGGAAPESV